MVFSHSHVSLILYFFPKHRKKYKGQPGKLSSNIKTLKTKKNKKKQYQKTCRNISETYEQCKYFSMNHGSNGRVLGRTGDWGRGTVALFKSCMIIKAQTSKTRYCSYQILWKSVSYFQRFKMKHFLTHQN